MATADLHGNLPDVPECEILLIAGDVCPMTSHEPHHQRYWLRDQFSPWLRSIPAKHVVGIGGNHDFVLEKEPWVARKLPWTYLLDSAVEIDGLRVWGTPWVPNLRAWAFHGEAGHSHFAGLPEGVDILLSHGPPKGYGDLVNGWGPVGDEQLQGMIERQSPKHVVCGHIHEGFGWYRHPQAEGGVLNAAYVDAFYTPRGPVLTVIP